MKKPGPGMYVLAMIIGAPFVLVGICLLIPPFTPVGFCLILLGGYPFYRVDKKRLMANLADHPLENGVEKPWMN